MGNTERASLPAPARVVHEVVWSPRGRPVPGTDLREVVTDYPYIIRYSIIGNTLRILRIRQTSRRPTNP